MLNRLTKKGERAIDAALGSAYSWPPGFRRDPPPPARQRMPKGWKPRERFDYLIILEDFFVGARHFGKGEHVRAGDPLAPKLLFECPDWVHPVDLSAVNRQED
jgi:hypothetical protein